jgi:2,3-bisphosphoglycerate-independent phosphoglycerate mutase
LISRFSAAYSYQRSNWYHYWLTVMGTDRVGIGHNSYYGCSCPARHLWSAHHRTWYYSGGGAAHLVSRGEGLSADISDTDSQEVGHKPLIPKAQSDKAHKAANLVGQFVEQASKILCDRLPANMILLRGFSMKPDFPNMQNVYGLDPGVIAAYPMYRGVAKLVGMSVLPTGSELGQEFEILEKHWEEHDFFFLHFKPIDSAGEDGDFNGKVALIEQADRYFPRLMDLKPDVVILTGDHSTPSVMKEHGWQPVPIVLWSRYCRPDQVLSFGERACVRGGLGPRLPATQSMPIALANAGRLRKFGA